MENLGSSVLKYTLLLLFGAIAALLEPVSAAQVGTAVVNGRVVVLDSDGTWRYQDAAEDGAASGGCATAKNIQVCAKAAGWQDVRKQAGFQFMYGYDNKYYLGIIIEPYGTKEGMTYEGLQAAIISNAASGAGTTEDKIPVLGTENEVAGQQGLRAIKYSAVLSGIPFVFYNVYKVYQDKSVQCVFWGIGKEMTAEFEDVAKKTLPHIKFD